VGKEQTFRNEKGGKKGEGYFLREIAISLLRREDQRKRSENLPTINKGRPELAGPIQHGQSHYKSEKKKQKAIISFDMKKRRRKKDAIP